MSHVIKFGTDGWRGRIADDYTFANVRRCTQGFAQYLIENGFQNEWVVVGHDMRFHGENFAVAVAEVLAGNGLRVYLTEGPSPTPVISYSVVAKSAIAAVNVTASHNPPTDNGFKVRDKNGGAVDPVGQLFRDLYLRRENLYRGQKRHQRRVILWATNHTSGSFSTHCLKHARRQMRRIAVH